MLVAVFQRQSLQLCLSLTLVPQDAENVIIALLLFSWHARGTCTSTVLYFVHRFFFMLFLSLPNLVFYFLIAEVCSTDSES